MAKTVEKIVILEDYIEGEKAPVTLYVSRNDEFNKMVICDEDGFEILNGSIGFMQGLAKYLLGVGPNPDVTITRDVEAEFQEVLNNKP